MGNYIEVMKRSSASFRKHIEEWEAGGGNDEPVDNEQLNRIEANTGTIIVNDEQNFNALVELIQGIKLNVEIINGKVENIEGNTVVQSGFKESINIYKLNPPNRKMNEMFNFIPTTEISISKGA